MSFRPALAAGLALAGAGRYGGRPWFGPLVDAAPANVAYPVGLAIREWSASCLEEGGGQAEITPIASNAATGEQSFAVVLPLGCLAQQWHPFAAEPRAQGPSRAVLPYLLLRRVGD